MWVIKMTNITLSLPECIRAEMDEYDEVRWSEVAKKAILQKIIELRKLALLKKYLEHQPFDDLDTAWMDEHDWHPVDEKQMKKKFVREILAAGRAKTRKVSVDELFE